MLPSFATSAGAQAERAVVIYKPSGSEPAPGCRGDIDLKFQELYGLKVNGKGDVRLLHGVTSTSGAHGVSRDDFEDGKSVDLKNLAALTWLDGVIFAETSAGARRVVAVPSNLKPDKEVVRAIRDFYNVPLEGELREDRSKKKVSVSLATMWRILFLRKGELTEEALFQHALRENKTALWKAYLRTNTSHRTQEARNGLFDTLLACSKSALEEFQKGDLNAAANARAFADGAEQIRADETVEQWKAAMDGAVDHVAKSIADAKKHWQTENWDVAVDLAGTLERYFDDDPELARAHEESVQRSHGLHLQAAKKLSGDGDLQKALQEFDIALKRLPSSLEAQQGKKAATVQLALRESQALRGKGLSVEARTLLLARLAEPDYANEPLLVEELRKASCERAAELYNKAEKLVIAATNPVNAASKPAPAARRAVRAAKPAPPTPPTLKRIMAATDEGPFKQARELMQEALGMCETESCAELLSRVDRALGAWHVEQAKRSIKRGAYGTAYLLLSAADQFDSELEEVPSLLEQARVGIEQKAGIDFSVVCRDRTLGGRWSHFLEDLDQAVQAGVRNSGLSVAFLEGGSRTQSAVLASAGSRLKVSLQVQLTRGDIKVSTSPRRVTSEYVFPNPDYETLKSYEDSAENNYKSCRKTSGDAVCQELRSQWQSYRQRREKTPKCNSREYEYRERDISALGEMEVTLTLQDSLGGAARPPDTLKAQVQEACTERTGVRSDDKSNSDQCQGLLARVLGKPITNQNCNIRDEDSYSRQMVEKIRAELETVARAALRDFTSRYVRHAEATAMDRESATEKLITFVFMSTDKTSPEVTAALAAIRAADEDLRFEGVGR
jgi:hypothetical protein